MSNGPFNMIYNPFDQERAAIDRMRYYQGFKAGKDKNMFEEEIKFAKESYEKIIQEEQKVIEDSNYYLIRYMENFCESNKKISQAKEKLSVLEYKLNGGK